MTEAWAAMAEAARTAPLHQWAAATAYVAVLAFVSLDLAAAARRDPGGTDRRHREARTASAMAAGAFVVGVAYTAVFALLWSLVGRAAPEALVSWWAAHPAGAFVAAFVAWDLSGWVYHVLGHRTRVGWAAHQAHHSGTDYNASLALRLSWTPFLGLAHHPLLALLGFDLRTIITCAAISNLLQALQHSGASVRWPRAVRAVVVTPVAHRHHHRLGGDGTNLGPVLTIWDRLAGTWDGSEVPADARYGSAGVGHEGLPSAEWTGWAALLGRRSKATRRVAPVS